jgi:hypothetical protein
MDIGLQACTGMLESSGRLNEVLIILAKQETVAGCCKTPYRDLAKARHFLAWQVL